jgi:hypothetical protein
MPTHKPKNELHLWAPQPPVADAALEELLMGGLKRTDTFHVVLIPQLMTPRWWRLFNKACDYTFVVSLHHFGWTACMNFFGLAFIFLSQSTGPGASREPHCWWGWEGTCARCSLRVKRMEGIFCRNFSSFLDSWPPCQNVWPAECYTSQGELPTFPTIAIEDKLGDPWHKEEERHKWLSQGVDGSHMCILFQCKVYWMRNLEGSDPVAGKDDVMPC